VNVEVLGVACGDYNRPLARVKRKRARTRVRLGWAELAAEQGRFKRGGGPDGRPGFLESVEIKVKTDYLRVFSTETVEICMRYGRTHLMKALVSGEVYFRVRVRNFTSRTEAQATAERLAGLGYQVLTMESAERP
jgi:hypothetical protein